MTRLVTLALVAMAALTWGGRATAEPEVTVTLDAEPTEVTVGQAIRLEVRVHTRGGSIEDLDFDALREYPELEIVSQQTVRPMQFSFGFGSGVQVESSLARVYVLRPTAAGTYDFAPAVATVDGRSYRSRPLKLVVRAGADGKGGPPDSSAPDVALDSKLTGARYDARAFLRTVVEPEEVYVGEQVDVTVYLYTRIRMSPQSVMPSKPSMDGFWVQDDPITSLESKTVTVRGTRYRAYLLHRSAAFPQRSGELVIGPPKVVFDAGTMSFFDVPERIQREGVPVTVRVKPLPRKGPPNAVVGQYDLEAWLDRTSVRTGDAVTLRVDATGVGNVQDLRIDLPPIVGVRALQPAIRDQQEQSAQGKLTGTRSWEWILIAESPGEHTVPSIELHYFDPVTEQYGSAATPTLTFTASGVAKQPQPAIEPMDAPPQRVKAAFGPVRIYSALRRGETPVRQQGWFIWVLALAPMLFTLVVLGTTVTRRRDQRSTTTAAVQRDLLRKARNALDRGEPRSFYDYIVASITHALDSRLKEPVAGLPHSDLRARLRTAGFDDDLVQRVINELEGADFARFAASGVDLGEMERCLERTSAIVQRIQRIRGSA